MHHVRGVSQEGPRASARADQGNLVPLQLILCNQALDDGDNLFAGFPEDRARRVFHGHADLFGQQLHPRVGGVVFGVRQCVISGLQNLQHDGGAGIGYRGALAVVQLDGDIVVRVVLARPDRIELRALKFLRVVIAGVFHICDVRAARPHVDERALFRAHHAAARDAQDPDVERVHIGPVPPDDGVIHGGTAVFNHADVCGRATDLKIDAVGSAQIHQRPDHAGGRAGQHGENRALFHLTDFHHAAVPAHNHQRNLDAGGTDAFFRAVGRVQHFGQDAGVDGGRAGSGGQTVQLRDVGSDGAGHALPLGFFGDNPLFRKVVDTEGLAGHDHLGAFVDQPFYGFADVFFRHVLDFKIGMLNLDEFSRSQIDIVDCGLLFGEDALQAALADADDADLGDVAFQKGVGRLGRAVGDEDDFLRLDVAFRKALLEGVHNSLRHALLVKMRGHNGAPPHDLVGVVVDCDRFGVRAADVDSDADCPLLHDRTSYCKFPWK